MLAESTFTPVASVKANETYTIGDIIDSMFQQTTLSKTVEIKKRKLIEKMLAWANLKNSDKYSQFHKAEVIQTIYQKIKHLDITDSVKCNYTREIKNLITEANILDEDMLCPYGVDDRKIILADDFTCIDNGEIIGKVSPEVISQMRKSN